MSKLLNRWCAVAVAGLLGMSNSVVLSQDTAATKDAPIKEAVKSKDVVKTKDVAKDTVKAETTSEKKENAAIKPTPKDANWVKRHEGFNERIKKGDVDLLFIGDSITDAWSGPGNEAWAKHWAPRKAVNLGIGGDRTQHVLWRLENGNVDGIKPKLAVLMIGTNNSNGNDHTGEEIGAGIKAIVAKLREKLPETKVLVLAVFPRGEKPNPQREKNAKASEIAAGAADNKMVYFMDIGPKFMEADGTIKREIMPDVLHLSSKAYDIWAEAIEPKVAELMGEKK